MGMIHVYTGDGKGKTTAAMGLALRCAGRGKRVLVFQFLKDHTSGEIPLLRTLPGVIVLENVDRVKFTCDMTEAEKQTLRNFYREKLEEVRERCGAFDLVILDEALPAVREGLLEEQALITLICQEAPEFVLTGRGATETICTYADYVTEMKKKKHPYDKGILAREGIDL